MAISEPTHQSQNPSVNVKTSNTVLEGPNLAGPNSILEIAGEKSGTVVSSSQAQNASASDGTFWFVRRSGSVLWKLAKFTGPGALISVAYIDPDNFQTAVSAGAEFKYKLLFMILISNLIATFLQALSAKLGCVTGLNLAEMNRKCLPRWLNIALWLLAEAAIICTDCGQVIGTGIAINLLIPKIPLIAGCALSVVDTLFFLAFYRPDGKLLYLRPFELFIAATVLGVFISFCVQLSKVHPDPGPVFRGYLPSREIFVSQGLYQSCAILGGTLMPHSIYLGSGIVQARLRNFDVKEKLYKLPETESYATTIENKYRPSLRAIRSCMSYTIAELVITLLVISIFVNSAILIVAGTSLSDDASGADLFGMYDLFKTTISQAAATCFALALLFSGTSSGIIATMAGQMVMEGAMTWRINPVLRRFATRLITIIPGMVIAAAKGREGLAAALNGCNVVLSVSLIFITAPLIWYTSRNKQMSLVPSESEMSLAVAEGLHELGEEPEVVSLANNWATTIAGGVFWVLIAVLNVCTLTLIGLGLS